MDETPPPSNDVTDVDEDARAALIAQLASLRAQHRQLDAEIEAQMNAFGAVTGSGQPVDLLKIRRMKKIKLSIKDQIAWLENQLTPDIIA